MFFFFSYRTGTEAAVEREQTDAGKKDSAATDTGGKRKGKKDCNCQASA